MRIGILGTRGIPNRYGGFEECAEKLALGLTARGHEVSVYCSDRQEYKAASWNGVRLIHCKDPEDRLGTFGQFIYDWHCLSDARRRDFDVLLQLGYTSNSVWWWRWPKNQLNVVNMDGLEWKRSKYSAKVQRFLKWAERWAARHGDWLVADSPGIQQHLRETYGKDSTFIPYGAIPFETPDESVLSGYELEPFGYHLLIARMEPENNIETIILGHLESGTGAPLIVVGGTGNAYGSALKEKYGGDPRIRFTGGIYDAGIINNLRYHSRLYFHGHSVGGTNPSLLEAMACRALIAAHGNVFNRAILGEEAFYFEKPAEVAAVIKGLGERALYESFLEKNAAKIRDRYNWPAVTDAYEQLFVFLLDRG